MRRAFTSTLLAAALLYGGAAFAQEAVAEPPTVPAGTAPADGAQPLSLEEMDGLHGRQGVTANVLTSQQLTGTTSGNTINAGTLTSGDVSFAPDAFAGFNGVGNFVVNTGANNTLQGAINLSVVTTPAS